MDIKIKNLVSGGAGFLGSHLIERLLNAGEEVICLDNFETSSKKNISKWVNNSHFKIIEKDILKPFEIQVDRIWHLACPASPTYYYKNPIRTSRISFIGTYNMLELARKFNSEFLLASSSEVYGDPKVHPQHENYLGHVNFTGARSCYSEGKRIAESLCYDYERQFSCKIKVARIFNTYGPRMNVDDGRVISKFIIQSLKKEALTIYGDGKQTRSFCYIDDLIDGLFCLMNSKSNEPINFGHPSEITILELAKIISSKINKEFNYINYKTPEDDPFLRNPSIKKAKKLLNWKPKINIEFGLDKTIDYYKKHLSG